MKEKSVKNSGWGRSRELLTAVVNELQLERIFVIFGLLYIPIAALYVGQGVAAYVILMLYTGIMVLLAFLMLAKFVVVLSAHANAGSGMYGSIVAIYFSNVFIPLVGLKVFAHVVWYALPPQHTGIVCDIVYFTKSLFSILSIQSALTWSIVLSLPVILLLGLWGVRKTK